MNILEMMKKAQAIKSSMEESQKKLPTMEVTGTSGGGMVSLTMTCDYKVVSISIDDSVKEDLSLLEDLLKAAMNDALEKVTESIKNNLSDNLGGLGLPPDFKMPF